MSFTQNNVHSPERIKREVKTLIEFIGKMCDPLSPAFPGFMLSGIIRNKLDHLRQKMLSGEWVTAQGILYDTREHFNCALASYAKGLMPELHAKLVDMYKATNKMQSEKSIKDLTAKASSAVDVVAQLCSRRFDVSEASNKYMEALRAISAVEDEFNRLIDEREDSKARARRERDKLINASSDLKRVEEIESIFSALPS